MEVSCPLDVFSRAALAKLKWCRYSIALASTMHSLCHRARVNDQSPENTYNVFLTQLACSVYKPRIKRPSNQLYTSSNYGGDCESNSHAPSAHCNMETTMLSEPGYQRRTDVDP